MSAALGIGTFEVERTVPMNMYNLSKGRCCFISIVGLMLAIVVVIVGLLGPPIFYSKIAVVNASSSSVEETKFIYSQLLYSPTFSRFNRHLVFKAVASAKVTNGATIVAPINVSVVVTQIGNNQSENAIEPLLSQRQLICGSEGSCEKFDLIRFVRTPDLPFTLDIDIISSIPLTGISFEFSTFNHEFTSFELWLRVSLVFVAFIAVCWFMHAIRKWSTDEWNLEQAWTGLLLCGLIFYNDPIFGILLLKPITQGEFQWPVVEIISFSFRTFYLFLLLTFWLSVMHGIRESTRGCCRFYVIKYALTMPIWILSISAYGYAMVCYTKSPVIDPAVINQTLTPVYIAMAVAVGLYLLAMLYHFLRSCVEVCRLSYLNIRLGYASCLCFGLIILAIGLYLSTFAIPEWRVMLFDPILFFYASPFIGLGLPVVINAHALLSTILYGPAVSKAPSLRSPKIKDSKPLVMGEDLDDSDEEVVYEDLKRKHRYHQYAPVSTRTELPGQVQHYQK